MYKPSGWSRLIYPCTKAVLQTIQWVTSMMQPSNCVCRSGVRNLLKWPRTMQSGAFSSTMMPEPYSVLFLTTLERTWPLQQAGQSITLTWCRAGIMKWWIMTTTPTHATIRPCVDTTHRFAVVGLRTYDKGYVHVNLGHRSHVCFVVY